MSDAVYERFDIVMQGISAEEIAKQWKLSREELDRYSYESHARAARARDEGRFEKEIIPVEVDVPADTTLTKEGASGREFILIVEGAAEVHRRGRKVNTLGAGDFLGEIALITGTPRTATVTTTEPTHVLVLTSQAFRSLLRQVPSIQIKVLETLARRIPDEFG